MEFGNAEDKRIFTEHLSKAELQDLERHMICMGKLIKKCGLGEYAAIEYIFGSSEFKCGIKSYKDTGAYGNKIFFEA